MLLGSRAAAEILIPWRMHLSESEILEEDGSDHEIPLICILGASSAHLQWPQHDDLFVVSCLRCVLALSSPFHFSGLGCDSSIYESEPLFNSPFFDFFEVC